MRMYNKIVLALFVLVAFFPLPFSASQAHAQPSASSAAAPRIDGFDVEPVAQPDPGNELVEVVVRLENGGSQTVFYATQPGFAVGARVTVENGTLAVVQ